jgi:hypothetical protein
MRGWFDAHPGGIYTISQPPKVFRSRKTRGDHVPVTVDESNHHFNATIAGSKWEVIPGWHILRHSFARDLDECLTRQPQIDAFREMLWHFTGNRERPGPSTESLS